MNADPNLRTIAHALTPDAVDTLRRLHDVAVVRAGRQHRRLIEKADSLPRGPLPVMARAAAAATEALHLLIALVALGDDEARRRLARPEDDERIRLRDGESGRVR